MKQVSKNFGNFLIWMAPFILFFAAIYWLFYLLQINFDKYFQIIQILAWPATVLILVFFFKKVVTYLFFSMDEFNFFGTKGNLKNVDEMIREKVDEKFEQESQDKERSMQLQYMAEEIKQKDGRLSSAEGDAKVNLDLAKKIFKEWQDDVLERNSLIENLKTDIKILKENLQKTLVQGENPTVSDNNTPEVGSGAQVNDLTPAAPDNAPSSEA